MYKYYLILNLLSNVGEIPILVENVALVRNVGSNPPLLFFDGKLPICNCSYPPEAFFNPAPAFLL